MSQLVRSALVSAMVCLAGAAPPVVGADAPAGALAVVGSNSLGSRGMNAALAIADHCAYVGSRNDAAPQVVDIGDPTSPRVVGALASHPGSTQRELRAVPSLKILGVLYYGLSGGSNGIDTYRWGSNCAAPEKVGHFDFGAAAPHEFYLWVDPSRPSRVLIFVTMFASPGEQLRVLDISDPASPSRVGGWTVPPGYGHAPLHSIDLSADGRTAYVSLWTGGLIVADSSDFATAKSGPALRPLTAPAAAFKTAPGNVHSAVHLPGQARVLTTDERYPVPFGAGCPGGTAHIVDVADPAHPIPVATLAVPENQASGCAAAARDTWTSHNATMTAHLALVTWYSAGLQVFALDDPTRPVRLAEFRASGVSPRQRDLQLGTTDTLSWSYPVVARGLVFFVDINQGLLVMRYTGAHQEEVSALDFAEGNSNVSRSTPTTAVATPAAPGPLTPLTSPSATSLPVPGPGNSQPALGLLGAAALALLGAAALVAVRARRRW
ncbi:MAG: LVIVD repeat-containing protein [Candidatus Dormibacteria bacterium]